MTEHSGTRAEDLNDPPSRQPERHGIKRLRWLREPDPHLFKGAYGGAPQEIPRFALMGVAEVNIEVATALIEELHDTLACMGLIGQPASPQ